MITVKDFRYTLEKNYTNQQLENFTTTSNGNQGVAPQRNSIELMPIFREHRQLLEYSLGFLRCNTDRKVTSIHLDRTYFVHLFVKTL
jgi:hypothetical protein